MSNTTTNFQKTTPPPPRPPHIALFPGSGMGHLTPFLRLAAMLASHNCTVTLITTQPLVSTAESNHLSTFFTTHPHIKRLEFQIIPSNLNNEDPFFIQATAIFHSAHLLLPLLSSLSPPLDAIFCDFFVATSVSQIADDLSIPNYIVCVTSTRFHSIVAYLPHLTLDKYAKFRGSDKKIEIPGLDPIPISSIPPPFFNSDNIFTTLLASNATSLSKAKGVLMNTFDLFDPESITSLNNGRILSSHPTVLPVGPFETYESTQDQDFPWLDDQPVESVLYVSFGSRTAMSKDQIRELGHGLERSGVRFFWVLKANKVDKDDKEELEELLGDSFLKRTKNKGMVVKGWVNQEGILAHPAIGGFLSHCGWNSVMEAAGRGVPILAWPLHGDQKINAEDLEKAGLGLWVRHWGWVGERLVEGEEIGEKVIELMGDENLRAKARKVGEEARKARMVGGSSNKMLQGVLAMLKPRE